MQSNNPQHFHRGTKSAIYRDTTEDITREKKKKEKKITFTVTASPPEAGLSQMVQEDIFFLKETLEQQKSQSSKNRPKKGVMQRVSSTSSLRVSRSSVARRNKRLWGLVVFTLLSVLWLSFAHRPWRRHISGWGVPFASVGGGSGGEGFHDGDLREHMFRHAPHYRQMSNASVYRVGLCADMDRVSKIAVANQQAWMSIFKTLTLRRNEDGTYEVEKMLAEVPLVSRLSEGGRGMELSELVYFYGKLLTFSDRTGVVYEVLERDGKLIPLWILADGDGGSEEGFKCEWATVKDDVLYVGSTGKAWQEASTGYEASKSRLWVKKVSREGRIEHIPWEGIYNAFKNATQTQSGFVIHEAVSYLPMSQRWFFLPRRMSARPWTAELERVGSNWMVSCNTEFRDWKTTVIGRYHPGHGYSSFKFVPFREHEVFALKTEENGDDVHTDLEVIDIVQGKILLHVNLGQIKYEGLEILPL